MKDTVRMSSSVEVRGEQSSPQQHGGVLCQGRAAVGTAWHEIWPRVLGVVMASSELKFPFCALKFLHIFKSSQKKMPWGWRKTLSLFWGQRHHSDGKYVATRLCLQSIVDSWVSWTLMCWKLELFFSLFFFQDDPGDCYKLRDIWVLCSYYISGNETGGSTGQLKPCSRMPFNRVHLLWGLSLTTSTRLLAAG